MHANPDPKVKVIVKREYIDSCKIKIKIFSFIVILSLVCPSLSQNTTISVFILGGQSNMGGSGGLANNIWDGVVPPECELDPRILWLSKEMKWEEAREPLHMLLVRNSSVQYGVSPGMPFRNYLLKVDPTIGVVGLVLCAAFGSAISAWSRDGHYYPNMVARARATVGEGGMPWALLWYQGESDVDSRTEAEAYGPRLAELFNNVRADLPIIQVALASGGLYREEIKEVQLHIELPNVKCVDAARLPLNPNNIHLTTPTQVQLESMLARAYHCANSSTLELCRL